MEGDEQNYENMHGGILKTIYLFLENNNLQETAKYFMGEVNRNYQTIDFDNIPARTLILRPLDNGEIEGDSVTNENIIILISGKSDMTIDLKDINNEVNVSPRDNNDLKCPKSMQCDNSDLSYNNEEIKMVTSYNTNSAKTEIANLENTLFKLQNEHLKLIQVASQLTSALSALEKDQKQNFHSILNKYKDALPDLYAYASQKQTDFVYLIKESVNEDQIESSESSVIESSHELMVSNFSGERTLKDTKIINHIIQSNKEVEKIPDDDHNLIESEIKSSIKQDILDNLSTTQGISFTKSPCKQKVFHVNTKSMRKFKSAGLQRDDSNLMNVGIRSLDHSPVKRRVEKKTTSLSASLKRRQPNLQLKSNFKNNKTIEQTVFKNVHVNNESTLPRSSSCSSISLNSKLEERTVNSAADLNDNTLDGPVSTIGTQITTVLDLQSDVGVSCGGDSFEKVNEEITEDLDYGSIKKALIDDDVDVKLKLLQALRWRLTQGKMHLQDDNLIKYIANDILHLNCGNTFLESYFCPKNITTPHPLQEEMARFINTLASLSIGREYLQKSSSFLKITFLPLLMGKIENIKIFDLTREFMIATTQKLSLYESMRELFVFEGVVEWIVCFISNNHQQMTNYEIEYSIALFTNMCIHKTARERCDRIPDKVVSLLMILINSQHTCCKTYLNGILYSMLSIPSINELAYNASLYEKIEERLKRANDFELIKQLELIMSLKNKRNGNEIDCYVNDEINTSEDFVEPELDMHDTVYAAPIGEKLLQKYQYQSPLLDRVLKRCKKACICGSQEGGDCGAQCTDSAAGDSCRCSENELETKRSTAVQASTHCVNKCIQTKEKEDDETPKVKKLIGVMGESDLETKLNELRKLFSSPSKCTDFVPCNLNFYCYNQQDEALFKELGTAKSKYSCDCYDVINEIVNDNPRESKVNLGPVNGGRKANNVTFGPFIPKVIYRCPTNICNIGVEKNVFRSKSKIKRTP